MKSGQTFIYYYTSSENPETTSVEINSVALGPQADSDRWIFKYISQVKKWCNPKTGMFISHCAAAATCLLTKHCLWQALQVRRDDDVSGQGKKPRGIFVYPPMFLGTLGTSVFFFTNVFPGSLWWTAAFSPRFWCFSTGRHFQKIKISLSSGIDWRLCCTVGQMSLASSSKGWVKVVRNAVFWCNKLHGAEHSSRACHLCRYSKTPNSLWNPQVHYHFQNIPPLVPYPERDQSNPYHHTLSHQDLYKY